MALSGSAGAYYRSNTTIPSSEGLHNADTIHCFIRSSVAAGTTNVRGVGGFVGNGGGAQRPHEYMSWSHTGGAFYKARQHRDAAAAYVSAQIAGTPATNVWESWASSYNGTNARIYRNGVLDGTSANAAVGASSTVFADLLALITYAGALDSSSQFAEGDVAEFAIWNTPLDADEIASLALGFRARLIRRASLILYAPCIRELQDVRGGRTLVKQAGTDTPVGHPRVLG